MTATNPSERDDDFLPVFIEFIQSLTEPQRAKLLEKLQPLKANPPALVGAIEEFVWTLDLNEGQKRRLAAIREKPDG